MKWQTILSYYDTYKIHYLIHTKCILTNIPSHTAVSLCPLSVRWPLMWVTVSEPLSVCPFTDQTLSSRRWQLIFIRAAAPNGRYFGRVTGGCYSAESIPCVTLCETGAPLHLPFPQRYCHPPKQTLGGTYSMCVSEGVWGTAEYKME